MEVIRTADHALSLPFMKLELPRFLELGLTVPASWFGIPATSQTIMPLLCAALAEGGKSNVLWLAVRGVLCSVRAQRLDAGGVAARLCNIRVREGIYVWMCFVEFSLTHHPYVFISAPHTCNNTTRTRTRTPTRTRTRTRTRTITITLSLHTCQCFAVVAGWWTVWTYLLGSKGVRDGTDKLIGYPPLFLVTPYIVSGTTNHPCAMLSLLCCSVRCAVYGVRCAVCCCGMLCHHSCAAACCAVLCGGGAYVVSCSAAICCKL